MQLFYEDVESKRKKGKKKSSANKQRIFAERNKKNSFPIQCRNVQYKRKGRISICCRRVNQTTKNKII